jgi:hypothetical protein
MIEPYVPSLTPVIPAASRALTSVGALLLAVWAAGRWKWSATDEGSIFRFLLIYGLALRITYASLLPDFHSPDEFAHFNYVARLFHTGSLPVFDVGKLDLGLGTHEFYQPPLYYALSLVPFAVGAALLGEGSAVLWAVRLFTILAWVATLGLVRASLDRLGIGCPLVRTTALALVALLPTYAYLSSCVNNDNLLVLLSTWTLYSALSPPSLRTAALTGLGAGACLLTKPNGVVVLFAVVVMLGARLWLRQIGLRRAVGHLMLTSALAGILWAPWLARNLALYGKPLIISEANPIARHPSLPEAIFGSVLAIDSSFWAVGGIYNEIELLPRHGRLLTLLVILGLVRAAYPFRSSLVAFRAWPHAAWGLGAAAGLLLNLALAVKFGVDHGVAQGRFLFPSLLPIALACGVAVGAIAHRWRLIVSGRQVALVFVGYATALSGLCLLLMRGPLAAALMLVGLASVLAVASPPGRGSAAGA